MSFWGKLNPLNWVAEVIKEPVVEWQKRKTLEVANQAKLAEQEHEIRLKKLDVSARLAEQGIKTEADWDARAQEGMKNSWKDEWFVALFSIPAVLAFHPDYQDMVLKGFKVLEETPQWYIMLLMGIVAATFGLRWLISRK